MKYTVLISSLFLSTHTSHAMERMPNATEIIIYNFLSSTLKSQQKKSTTGSSIATEFCIKGITFNDLPMIRHGIEMGADINYINPKMGDLTFIQIACKGKKADIVAELLKAPHININAYAKNTAPAFHFAVANKDKNIINLLIAHDPETVNVHNADGDTCLHLLCGKNYSKKMLQFVLSQNNINPNICNNDKKTPLHIASANGFTDYIQLLLLNKADTSMKDRWGQTPFFDACSSGKINNVKLLLPINTQEINSQDYNGDTPLHMACDRGHIRITRFLLKKGARPTIKNIGLRTTPLAHAYFELNNDDFTTFYSPSLKKLLLKKDRQGNTQLHLAALLTNVREPDDYLSFLVANGLSVWSRNKKNQLPVDCACEEYTQLYNQCYNCYKTKKLPYFYKTLINPEIIMHAFLRLTSPKTEYMLFTTMLEHLPKDLHKGIAYYYYALNIETIIAKKYTYKTAYYYDDFMETKNEIKRQLLITPEPKLLW